MGKPYFAYNNLVPNSTVTARTQDSAYPASNLAQHRLWPGYRSADKCLVLNGVDEYAYVPDHADFDFTSWLFLEVAIRFLSFGSQQIVIAKSNVSGQKSFQVDLDSAGLLRFAGYGDGSTEWSMTYTEPLELGRWYHFRIIYAGFVPYIVIQEGTTDLCYWDGSGGTEFNCVVSGSLSTSLFSGASSLSVGAQIGGGSPAHAEIGWVGIYKTSPTTISSYLGIGLSSAYWNFNGNLSDGSGNGHTLTGVGIDSNNFKDFTGYQWLQCAPIPNQSPEYLFIDRRHNLSTSAIVRVGYGENGPDTEIASTTVVANEPVVLDFTVGIANVEWVLDIHDPDNPDGYIELPYVYLGSKTPISRNILRGYRHSQRRHGSILADAAGGYTGYASSEQLWEADIQFRTQAADYSILENVADAASLMRPFVFSEDGTDTNTHLVYWTNAMDPDNSHILDTQNMVNMQLEEAGGGI